MSQEHNSKSVQFSRFIKISFTYPGDEYDRSALEPAKLTFSEATELLQLRIDWKQDLKRRQEQQQQLLLQDQQDSEDGYSSDEARVPGSIPAPRSFLSGRNDSDCSSLSSEDDEYSQSYMKGIMHHRHSQRF